MTDFKIIGIPAHLALLEPENEVLEPYAADIPPLVEYFTPESSPVATGNDHAANEPAIVPAEPATVPAEPGTVPAEPVIVPDEPIIDCNFATAITATAAAAVAAGVVANEVTDVSSAAPKPRPPALIVPDRDIPVTPLNGCEHQKNDRRSCDDGPQPSNGISCDPRLHQPCSRYDTYMSRRPGSDDGSDLSSRPDPSVRPNLGSRRGAIAPNSTHNHLSYLQTPYSPRPDPPKDWSSWVPVLCGTVIGLFLCALIRRRR